MGSNGWGSFYVLLRDQIWSFLDKERLCSSTSWACIWCLHGTATLTTFAHSSAVTTWSRFVSQHFSWLQIIKLSLSENTTGSEHLDKQESWHMTRVQRGGFGDDSNPPTTKQCLVCVVTKGTRPNDQICHPNSPCMAVWLFRSNVQTKPVCVPASPLYKGFH